MASTSEVIDETAVIGMDLEELKKTSRDFDVDAGDLGETIPTMAHHMTVRGKLEALVEQDVLSYNEMDQVYDRWNERKQ